MPVDAEERRARTQNCSLLLCCATCACADESSGEVGQYDIQVVTQAAGICLVMHQAFRGEDAPYAREDIDVDTDGAVVLQALRQYMMYTTWYPLYGIFCT